MSENPIEPAKKLIEPFKKQRARYRLLIGAGAAAIVLGSILQMTMSSSVAHPRERIPFLIGVVVACLCTVAAAQELRCPACGDFPGRGEYCGSCGVQLKE
jgi:hypothetical protein